VTNELIRRLEALERRVNAEQPSGMLPPDDPFQVVVVYGGLTPFPVVASDDTGHEWIRDVAGGETIEDFAQRSAHESHGHGARLCTIGDMGRQTPLQVAALRAAWDEYMATDYPDVPPIEESAPARRPSMATTRAPFA
jgi:hypothetical protein